MGYFSFTASGYREVKNYTASGIRTIRRETEDPKVPIKLVHKMTEAQVKKEAAHPELKLKWKETLEELPQQHMVVFEKVE